MGKTPEKLRLRLLVHPSLAERPEFQALVEKGHTVITDPCDSPVWDFDGVIGPTAWRMTERHLRYLDEALHELRKIRLRNYAGKDTSA